MKVKTSELTGAALDWAVAKCEGRDKTYLDYFASQWHLNKSLRYSTDWAQGGPIIEREKIELRHLGRGTYASYPQCRTHFGSTPLIAAMRCYVASKLGDEIEIPEELK